MIIEQFRSTFWAFLMCPVDGMHSPFLSHCSQRCLVWTCGEAHCTNMLALQLWYQILVAYKLRCEMVAPSAVFVHCYAHHLNLVLNQGLKSIPMAKIFFATLGGFSSNFCKSTKVVMMFEESGCPKVPSSAPTCWNFTSRIVNTVALNRESLIDTLTLIIGHPSMDDESIRTADGLKK